MTPHKGKMTTVLSKFKLYVKCPLYFSGLNEVEMSYGMNK